MSIKRTMTKAKPRRSRRKQNISSRISIKFFNRSRKRLKNNQTRNWKREVVGGEISIHIKDKDKKEEMDPIQEFRIEADVSKKGEGVGETRERNLIRNGSKFDGY